MLAESKVCDPAVRKRALDAALNIDGWLTENEAAVLFDAAFHATGPIVEIGSWQGRSTTALALGSMAGSKQPVYAIDDFDGVPPSSRATHHGTMPGWKMTTPEMLRANLDAAGVNGLVKIIPKKSWEAAPEIPECGVLFVDGGHDYMSVTQDLCLYMPKLKDRGRLAIHDVWDKDMDVVRAVNEQVMSRPNEWQVRGRADSLIFADRRTVARKTVMLAMPGPDWSWGAIRGMDVASIGAHEVIPQNEGCGWDAMNKLWVDGLNGYKTGQYTHFAMLHSDVTPIAGWIDVLMGVMEDRKADLVSTVIPIKDKRGLTSSGWADPSDPWSAFRRLTMREVMQMPETFGPEETQYPDKVFLHNTGCWLADLSRPCFHETDADGVLKACFAFPLRILRHADGSYSHQRESEDWYFSRMLHGLGAKTAVTREVTLTHAGLSEFDNASAWGTYKTDEDTRDRWGAK